MAHGVPESALTVAAWFLMALPFIIVAGVVAWMVFWWTADCATLGTFLAVKDMPGRCFAP